MVNDLEATRSLRGWTLTLTSLAFFMVALDALVVITALPAIHRDLGAGLATLQWTVNAYSLAFGAGIITAASVGDRFGRRRVFATGLALFTAASAACAVAPTAELLIVARAIQGLGGAMIMPLSLTILTATFPLARRGVIVGLWGGIGGLAVASGPLVGGAVTQGLDWHWIFWVNVPIGLAATILTLRQLVESRGPASQLDLLGAGLVSGGAIGIVWALVRANDVGWGSAEIISALVLGTVLMAAFVAWERHVPEPMLPMGLFRNRSFAAANATGFLMTGSLMAAAFLISQYLQVALGYSPLSAGLHFLPMTATPLLVAPVAGALSDRIGPRPVLVFGMLLLGGGLGWFAQVAGAVSGYQQLLLPLLVAGTGASMVLPTTATAALSAVPYTELGKASGATSTLQRFGGVFGIASTTAVFEANGHLASGSFNGGFQSALALAAGLSLLGAISALAVPARRRPAAQPEREAAVLPQPEVAAAATFNS